MRSREKEDENENENERRAVDSRCIIIELMLPICITGPYDSINNMVLQMIERLPSIASASTLTT